MRACLRESQLAREPYRTAGVVDASVPQADRPHKLDRPWIGRAPGLARTSSSKVAHRQSERDGHWGLAGTIGPGLSHAGYSPRGPRDSGERLPLPLKLERACANGPAVATVPLPSGDGRSGATLQSRVRRPITDNKGDPSLITRATHH